MPISRSKAKEDLQRQAKKIPSEIDITARLGLFQSVANTAGPADIVSAVLSASGLLEYALAEAIASRLKITTQDMKLKIFEGTHEREGVIGTIYTRDLMAHALDIYGEKTHADVSTVRVVRNICAHAKTDIDFSSESIRTLCVFHSVNSLRDVWADFPMTPQASSPIGDMMEFIGLLVPYLLVHASGEWGPMDPADWRNHLFC